VGILAAAAAAVSFMSWGASGAFAAATPTTWCGAGAAQADRKPDLLAGPQVRVVYAHPADSPDRFAAFASPIASDVAAIGAWWRTQDPTRAPRFDLYPFPGCGPGPAALDITDVKLPQPAAYYRLLSSAFTNIVDGLANKPHRKYLVYWDAPVSDVHTCGQGSDESGSGVVFVQSCTTAVGDGGFGAAVAAHELLHTLGAVPSTARHNCPPPDDGHACDGKLDIMYPYVGGAIDDLVLDVNHDDYYGIGGAQDVRNSHWLEHLDLPHVALTVTSAGAGHVTSDAGAIDCPGACTTEQEQNLVVTLKATAESGSHFTGRSGACTGFATCAVTLDAAKEVHATFAPGNPVKIVVRGKGKVVSAPGSDAVTLRAVPAKGYRFVTWGGACSGHGTCTVRFGSAFVRATFARR